MYLVGNTAIVHLKVTKIADLKISHHKKKYNCELMGVDLLWWSFCNIYICQMIMFYTLNKYNIVY